MKRHDLRCWAIMPVVVCLLSSLPAFAGSAGTTIGATTKDRLVSISQFAQHPSLDAILRGFMDYFEYKGLPVRYSIHVAKGDEKTNSEISERIIRENADLILAVSTPSTQACLRARPKVPILFAAVTDPIGAGLVESLERPGRQITGMTDMSPVNRQVFLIKELQPDLKRLGTLYNPDESNSESLVGIVRTEAVRLGVDLAVETATDRNGVISGIQRLAGRCEAVYVPTDNTVISAIDSVALICRKNRLPLYTADVDSVPRGAVVALAIDYYKMGTQTARMAERIFNGEDPSLMPVESLQDLRIHVNTRAAEAMGVEIPVSLLQAADAIYDSFPDNIPSK